MEIAMKVIRRARCIQYLLIVSEKRLIGESEGQLAAF